MLCIANLISWPTFLKKAGFWLQVGMKPSNSKPMKKCLVGLMFIEWEKGPRDFNCSCSWASPLHIGVREILECILNYILWSTCLFSFSRTVNFHKWKYNWPLPLYQFEIYNIWFGIWIYCEMITRISLVNILHHTLLQKCFSVLTCPFSDAPFIASGLEDAV